MLYESDVYGGSKVAYDGELLPARDVLARLDRDERIWEKYEEAVENLEEKQMTFDDVRDKLNGI